MKKLSLIAFTLFLSACAQPGKVGDECSADADCGEGLECHMHEGEEDHGEWLVQQHHSDRDLAGWHLCRPGDGLHHHGKMG